MPTIELPAGFITGVASSSNNLIAGMSGYIELVLGVLLAGVVLGLLIHALSGRH